MTGTITPVCPPLVYLAPAWRPQPPPANQTADTVSFEFIQQLVGSMPKAKSSLPEV